MLFSLTTHKKTFGGLWKNTKTFFVFFVHTIRGNVVMLVTLSLEQFFDLYKENFFLFYINIITKLLQQLFTYSSASPPALARLRATRPGLPLAPNGELLAKSMCFSESVRTK